MKTARFSNVVEGCGEPEEYVLWMDPSKDRVFQAAIKANRVMTIFQTVAGNKTDRAEVGFQAGRGRQFLVFPKSLREFAGREIIGIKYDLLASPKPSKTERSSTSRPRQPKARAKKLPAPKGREQEPVKVVPFKVEAPSDEEGEEDKKIEELKNQVRHAMVVLEQGKAVAAFNLLKRILE